MVQWGTNQYTTNTIYSQCVNSTVFNQIRDAHVDHILFWQWILTDANIQSIANLCAAIDPPLTLWVDLDYNVADAVDLVTKLGTSCRHYEVCKEPHIAGHCEATATVYAQRWRDVVTACRAVTDNLSGTFWYGGPVSGRPTNRLAWYQAWLNLNSDIIDASNTFLSYHWYTHYSGALPTQATLISNATNQIASDVQDFRDECNSYLGYELPIALTEFNWTADPAASPNYSLTDQTFMNNWTNAAMNACVNNDVWAAFFWNWGGSIENTMNIILNQSHAFAPKYQYYSIQNFLEGAGSGTKVFTAGGRLQNQIVTGYIPCTAAAVLALLGGEGLKTFDAKSHLENEAEPAMWEWWDEDEGGYAGVADNFWQAQSFTVGNVGHTISSVKLLLFRVGTPGDLTVSIQNVTVNHKPMGDETFDLTVGTVNCDAITELDTGEWVEVTLIPEISLNTNTEYTIVARALDGSYGGPGGDQAVNWCSTLNPGLYADGHNAVSAVSGAIWWAGEPGYVSTMIFQVFGSATGILAGSFTFDASAALQALGIQTFSANSTLHGEIGPIPQEPIKSFTAGARLYDIPPTAIVVSAPFARTLATLERNQASWSFWDAGTWKPGMWEQDNILRKAIKSLEKQT